MMRWSSLRIALLDDHALIREALSVRLSAESDLSVEGIYSTSTELVEGLRQQEFDLLILDYQLSDGELDGLRLIQFLRQRYPALRIIIFSSAERPATVNMCIRTGANGFVGKSQNTDDLLKAIRVTRLDRIYLPPAMAEKMSLILNPSADYEEEDLNIGHALVNFPKLSPKESEVLRCCLEGLSVGQIAIKFSRSRKTISGQKQTAFRKLGISTDTELFKLQAYLNNI